MLPYIYLIYFHQEHTMFQNLSARNAGIANPPHTFLHTELFQNQDHLMMKVAQKPNQKY